MIINVCPDGDLSTQQNAQAKLGSTNPHPGCQVRKIEMYKDPLTKNVIPRELTYPPKMAF